MPPGTGPPGPGHRGCGGLAGQCGAPCHSRHQLEDLKVGQLPKAAKLAGQGPTAGNLPKGPSARAQLLTKKKHMSSICVYLLCCIKLQEGFFCVFGWGCCWWLWGGVTPPDSAFAASCKPRSKGVSNPRDGRLALAPRLVDWQGLLPGLPPQTRKETTYREKRTHCNANAQKGPPPRH